MLSNIKKINTDEVNCGVTKININTNFCSHVPAHRNESANVFYCSI